MWRGRIAEWKDGIINGKRMAVIAENTVSCNLCSSQYILSSLRCGFYISRKTAVEKCHFSLVALIPIRSQCGIA